MELKGLSNLYALGNMFQSATKRETEQYSLSLSRWDLHNSHYGVKFKVKPKDTSIEVEMSIALWINNQELLAIGIDRQIEAIESFSFNYAENPYWDKDDQTFYFEANDNFYQEFGAAETFDAQVDLVSRYIDEACLYILKNIEAGT